MAKFDKLLTWSLYKVLTEICLYSHDRSMTSYFSIDLSSRRLWFQGLYKTVSWFEYQALVNGPNTGLVPNLDNVCAVLQTSLT